MKTSLDNLLKVVTATFLLVCFSSLSEAEHLWNKEKCFLFHFERSFRSWDNHFNFLDIQMSWRHQMPNMKHKTNFTE